MTFTKIGRTAAAIATITAALFIASAAQANAAPSGHTAPSTTAATTATPPRPIGTTATAATVAKTATATATTSPYQNWRFRDGQICLQDHGSTRYDGTTVAAKWNAADVNIVSKDICTGYSRGMIIDIQTYNSPSDIECAKTGSNSYSWEYVWSTGVKVARWVPNLMVIWINVAPAKAALCNSTSGMRAHLLSHETGHAIGLAHLPKGTASVMPPGSWSVWWPTLLDLNNVNGVY